MSPYPPLLVSDYDRASASPKVATEGGLLGPHDALMTDMVLNLGIS
jgi:hypothetical protein